MKQIVILIGFLLLISNSFSQLNENNYKYCKEISKTENVNLVKSLFVIDSELNQNQINTLTNLLFEKTSIYKIELNSKHNEIIIFHLSDVSYEDIKLLLEPMGIEFNFKQTTKLKKSQSEFSE